MSSVEEENTAKSKTGGNAMSKADVIEVEGTVLEKLPNAMFKVELENKHVVLARECYTVRRTFVNAFFFCAQKTGFFHHEQAQECVLAKKEKGGFT